MNRTQLLRHIGAGKYDSEIPVDYETSKVLYEAMLDGLIDSRHIDRIDDLFWLTRRGKFLARMDHA